MANVIYIIGIGEDGAGGLTPGSLRKVQESEVLLGGERQLSFFSRYDGEKITLQGGLKPFADKLEGLWKAGKRIAVLASGDPLFFGIGGYLAKRFGPEQVEVIPYYSSVQLAFPGWVTAGRMQSLSVCTAGRLTGWPSGLTAGRRLLF